MKRIKTLTTKNLKETLKKGGCGGNRGYSDTGGAGGYTKTFKKDTSGWRGGDERRSNMWSSDPFVFSFIILTHDSFHKNR